MRWDQRHRVAEIMDDPSLDAGEHVRALRGLTRLNWVSANGLYTWLELKRLLKPHRSGPVTLLDLACGAGDLPISLWQRAKSAGIDLRVSGCDRSAVAIEHAQASARERGTDVEFFVSDVFAQPSTLGRYDFITSSLFFHHLSDEEAIDLLRRMKSMARCGVLVNDLCRGALWYALVWTAARLVTTSRVVHVDGPRSIAAAFKPREFQSLALQSGLTTGRTRVYWPARFIYTWMAK